MVDSIVEGGDDAGDQAQSGVQQKGHPGDNGRAARRPGDNRQVPYYVQAAGGGRVRSNNFISYR